MNRRKHPPGEHILRTVMSPSDGPVGVSDTPRSVVGRAHSTLSVSAVDYYLNLPESSPPSPAISTVTLTPGRIRNIDQDMEALRASRQDNPIIQV